jgi:hypothetical protein
MLLLAALGILQQCRTLSGSIDELEQGKRNERQTWGPT